MSPYSRPAMPLAELTEKDWSRQVYTLAAMLGWRRYHTYRSTKSPAGFPDETLVRDRVVFVELKRASGKLSEAQKEWIRRLLAAGAEAYVARPSDLEDLAARLQARSFEWGPLAERTRAEVLP